MDANRPKPAPLPIASWRHERTWRGGRTYVRFCLHERTFRRVLPNRTPNPIGRLFIECAREVATPSPTRDPLLRGATSLDALGASSSMLRVEAGAGNVGRGVARPWIISLDFLGEDAG